VIYFFLTRYNYDHYLYAAIFGIIIAVPIGLLQTSRHPSDKIDTKS
jgi:hypothetical protein